MLLSSTIIGVVHRDLRLAVRNLERLLCMSKEADANAQLLTNTPHTNTLPTQILDSKNANHEFICVMPTGELGILMSILYRIQNILVLNSSHFEELTLRLLQVTFIPICMYRIIIFLILVLILVFSHLIFMKLMSHEF